MKFSISHKKLVLALSILLFYMIALLLRAKDLEMLLCCLFMSINLFLTLLFAFDLEESLFSIRNMFVLLLFGIGIFARFLYTLYVPEVFGTFLIVRKINSTWTGHLKTMITIFVFIIGFIIGNFNNSGKGRELKGTVHDNININKATLVIIYYSLLLAYVIYSFLNIRIATEHTYGVFDNIFNMLSVFIRLLAYMYLIAFFEKNDKKYFIRYLAFVLPYVLVSLLSLFKGPIILEVLLFMVVRARYKKITFRSIVLLVLLFLIVYPAISLLRIDSFASGDTSLSIANILEYNAAHNPINYIFGRFQYYDEAYYIVNLDYDRLVQFRMENGGIIEKFFASLIPRFLWATKPMVNSSYMVTYFLCKLPTTIRTSLTIGLIGEAFAYGSNVLVCIVGLFIGRLLRIIDNKRNLTGSYFALGIYISAGSVIFGLAEGDIVAKLISLLILGIVIGVTYILGFTKKTKG